MSLPVTSSASASFDQDSVLCALARADHDRRRRCEPERAGTGDEEHRDRVQEREHERGLRPPDEPDHERHDRNHDHRRDEIPGDHVGQTLDRSLRALRLLNQADDLGEHRLVADLRRLEDESAGGVDRGPDHGIALALRNGNAFARYHALVDRALAFGNDASHRDLLARAHDDEIANTNLFHWHVHVLAIAADARRAGLERHELLNGGRRPRFRPHLDQPAEKDQRDDHRRRLVVDPRLHSLPLQPSAEERGREAVKECRTRADPDEGVHVSGAVLQRVVRPLEEPPAAVDEDRSRQRELDITVGEKRDDAPEGTAGHRQELVPHRADHDRDREYERNNEPPGDIGDLVLPARRSGIAGLLVTRNRLHLVAAPLHGVRELVRRGHARDELHGDPLGGGVHLRAFDAVLALEQIL